MKKKCAAHDETPRPASFLTRLLPALALLCLTLLAAGEAAAAPLKVVGRSLQDAHGNNILIRGVNVPVYKSGYADDLDAVAAAIALTKTNAVRLEWWAVPLGGQTEYTVANLDRAIQKFYDLGIIPVIELHDLTFVYGQDAVAGPNSTGNDRAIFANTITAFWTRPDVLAILVKHQDHLVINLANEWGSSFYSDATPTTTNFIQNYTDAIAAMRNAGIVAPLMVDAPKGFEYQFLLDHGQALLAADPQGNTMLSTHAYWAASDPAFTDAGVNAILDALKNTGLPIVLGEASSNAYTNIPCDPIHYANLLTRANTNAIGYLFWAWYEDGQCGPLMNVTADGVTLPTVANPGFGYDAINGPGYGIDVALPATLKADFSPVAPLTLNEKIQALVTGYYQTILGRSPDQPGLDYWTSEATRLSGLGIDINETWYVMAGYFFNSPEYIGYNKTDAQFVTNLYTTFFKRAPDAGGLAYWMGQIANGMPREVVLYSFMFSPEFRTFTTGIFGNTASRPEVNMVVDFFRGLLNRLPDTPSFNYWLAQLKTAQCTSPGAVYTAVENISLNFMYSPEYGNRGRTNTQFVTDMYYTFLRRGGDLTGVQFWVNELQSGRRTANQVRQDFIASPEFGARVQAVIGAGCVP